MPALVYKQVYCRPTNVEEDNYDIALKHDCAMWIVKSGVWNHSRTGVNRMCRIVIIMLVYY